MTCPNCGAQVSYIRSQCPNCSRLELAKGNPPSGCARAVVAVFLFGTGFITTAVFLYAGLDTFNNLFLGLSIAVGVTLMVFVDTIWMRSWSSRSTFGKRLSRKLVSNDKLASETETGAAEANPAKEEVIL